MKDNWYRVSKTKRCAICGKPDWCIARHDGTAVICPRVPDGAKRHLSRAGYLHILDDSRPVTHYAPPACVEMPGPVPDIAAEMQKAEKAMTVPRRRTLAEQLGVTPRSLFRLGTGWHHKRQCWAWPMVDDHWQVIGIRLRTHNGDKKFAVTGSHNGLFLPVLSGRGPLVICEGPTDTAAIMDLGFEAVGRPSCSGGTEYVRKVAAGRKSIVIMADRDGPGLDGAARLAKVLRRRGTHVQVIAPPEGIKDARAWLRAGATTDDVLEVMLTTGFQYPVRPSTEMKNRELNCQDAPRATAVNGGGRACSGRLSAAK